MALLKLYRGAAAPALEVGKIWFDSANQVIKVCTTTTPAEGSDGWEPYGLSEAEIAALILDAKNEVLGTLEADDAATLKALNEEIDALQADLATLAAKTVTINEKADGHVTVSKATDEKTGAVVYTVAENDIASAKGLADEIKRATDEEARIAGLVTTEQGRAEDAEKALADRLDVIEGEGEGSIKKAVADAKAAIEGTLADDDAKTLEAINDELDTLAARGYKVAEVTEGLPANIERRYQLVDQTGAVIEGSVNIDVEKESALKNVELVDVDAAGVAGNYLKWTYVLADGTEKVQYLNVSDLLVEAEFKNGLDVSAAGEVSVKVDAVSEAFLTVGTDGVKLAGVQDAINAAETAAKKHADDKIAALDADKTSAEKYTVTTTAEDGTESTEEVNHKVRVQVVEVDGVVTGVNVTESDIASAKTVREHEIVVSAALNDLNARVDGHATRLDELEAGLGAVEHTTVSDGDNDDFVTITETTEGSHKNYAVSATVVKGAKDNAGLATDAYVREQIAAAALVWETGSFVE